MNRYIDGEQQILDENTKLDIAVEEAFGYMREATPEESESVYKYVKSIAQCVNDKDGPRF